MRDLLDILVSVNARGLQISDLCGRKLTHAFAEYRKLKEILRNHALRKKDYETLRWLDAEQGKLDTRNDEIAAELSDAEERELSIQYQNLTDEEIVERWKHLDKLSELAERKIKEHVKYVQDLNKRLKSKIEQITSA